MGVGGSGERLVDSFGRTVADLRISITDRCNLRCTYCMPAEGLDWLPREELLTFEEITRLARLFVDRFGVGSIRLTGGEPTVRAHLPRLVAMLSPLGADLALTTNGLTLDVLAGDLVAAGLDRINVSLDTLRPERFREICRRDGLDRVVAGVVAAREAGLAPVKVNAVLQRGVNDDEILDLAAFGRDHGVDVRFIEFMPLDADGTWGPDRVVPAAEILQVISARYPVEALAPDGEPAATYRYLDGAGTVGVIPTVTEPFCGSCDRVRLTAEGGFRTCLFALEETDLRAPLRAGATDDELAGLIRTAVAGKWAGHAIGNETFVRPPRSMSQIGG